MIISTFRKTFSYQNKEREGEREQQEVGWGEVRE